MKAIIYFSGDESVGIFNYQYEAEIPDPQDKEDRRSMKAILANCYEVLDGERVQYVIFEDEEFNDDGKLTLKEANK